MTPDERLNWMYKLTLIQNMNLIATSLVTVAATSKEEKDQLINSSSALVQELVVAVREHLDGQ